MKPLLIFFYIFLSNHYKLAESVNLRIYNNSEYYVKEYTVIIESHKISYEEMPPHTFSQYKEVPFIYDSNEDECTFLMKKFLGHSQQVKLHTFPIDHIGDKKIESGSATLTSDINKHHKKVDITTVLKTE